jgi:hypothetical protein
MLKLAPSITFKCVSGSIISATYNVVDVISELLEELLLDELDDELLDWNVLDARLLAEELDEELSELDDRLLELLSRLDEELLLDIELLTTLLLDS